MIKETKVVIGSNAGDEGKGLVSYCLSKDAVGRGHRVLNILYNGGVQRGHTAAGKVYHCTGTGAAVGADTYYHKKFLVDPIALWLTGDTPIIDPMCRVVLPCDVINNRRKEKNAGEKKHGSCGLGIFEASKRNADPNYAMHVSDLLSPYAMYSKLKRCNEKYGNCEDEIYNTHHFMLAAAYVIKECRIASFDDIANDYQTAIYEGGQGLLLDQGNVGAFPFLTPSSVGSRNIHNDIEKLGCDVELYYVSRTYMTRHGKGPMENECQKEDINSTIIDETNLPNEWQGDLRFGYLNQNNLYKRIKKDLDIYKCKIKTNMVFTQANYTNGMLATSKGQLSTIAIPDYMSKLYISYAKDDMFEIR